MNTFDALNVFYREDAISDFLVNCFQDSREFLLRFLQKAGLDVQEDFQFFIETRVGLGKAVGTPDIVIRLSGKGKDTIVLIENKMGATEGKEQTVRYESSKAKEKIAARYGVAVEELNFHYVYLALDKTVKPISTKFVFLDYSIFLSEGWPLYDDNLRKLFKEFQEKLDEFYSPVMNPYESIEQNLSLNGLQRKICWQKILAENFFPLDHLDFEWGEVGGAGRKNFLFLIRKPDWESAETFHQAGLSKTFYVHIDTYINMLQKGSQLVRDIGVRFETNPYVPHWKIDRLPDYDTFLENKRIFAEMLYARAKKQGIRCKKRNSKLLALSVMIGGETISENMQDLQKQVLAIESCIDEVIAEMKSKGMLR